jgi:hypothetical protein
MVKTTRLQREAIARLWSMMNDNRYCYRDLRRQVQGTFAMDGAIVVPYCGMLVAIERDGYSHT